MLIFFRFVSKYSVMGLSTKPGSTINSLPNNVIDAFLLCGCTFCKTNCARHEDLLCHKNVRVCRFLLELQHEHQELYNSCQSTSRILLGCTFQCDCNIPNVYGRAEILVPAYRIPATELVVPLTIDLCLHVY